MSYRAETCTGPDGPLDLREFESVIAWREWINDNHPGMPEKFFRASPSLDQWQVGTDYHWSKLTKM